MLKLHKLQFPSPFLIVFHWKLDELFAGITHAATEYKVDVIGRYTSSQKLIISITVIGEADEDEIVYRNAKQTDLLVVTGDIGAAYMGLQVLEREKQFSGKS
jgi:thiamine-monophosphate kinase